MRPTNPSQVNILHKPKSWRLQHCWCQPSFGEWISEENIKHNMLGIFLQQSPLTHEGLPLTISCGQAFLSTQSDLCSTLASVLLDVVMYYIIISRPGLFVSQMMCYSCYFEGIWNGIRIGIIQKSLKFWFCWGWKWICQIKCNILFAVIFRIYLRPSLSM